MKKTTILIRMQRWNTAYNDQLLCTYTLKIIFGKNVLDHWLNSEQFCVACINIDMVIFINLLVDFSTTQNFKNTNQMIILVC